MLLKILKSPTTNIVMRLKSHQAKSRVMFHALRLAGTILLGERYCICQMRCFAFCYSRLIVKSLVHIQENNLTRNHRFIAFHNVQCNSSAEFSKKFWSTFFFQRLFLTQNLFDRFNMVNLSVSETLQISQHLLP